MICPSCGRYGRYEVTVEYTCFSLFFIPILKWNKKYYVKSSCCGSIYLLSKDIGDKISGDGNVNLTERDLKLVRKGKITLLNSVQTVALKQMMIFNIALNAEVVLGERT